MISAKIIQDSVAPHGGRITSFILTYPRFIHSELMTHRMFCLAGDTALEFDLPSGQKGVKYKRAHKMTIADFVDRWHNGANRVGSKPKSKCDTSWINPNTYYSTQQAASNFGMATATNLNGLCRSGKISAERADNGRTWLAHGKSLLEWRNSSPEHTRFDMRARLSSMKIRQFNEDSGCIQTSHVVNAVASGRKEVFELKAGNFHVAGSADHRVLTTDGWKTIGQIRRGDCVIVQKHGKRIEDVIDSLRLRNINGVWRSGWQSEIRNKLRAESPICRRCGKSDGSDVHHVVPVHVDPSLALDESNVTLLCNPCHNAMHKTQGWQGGTYLYGSAVSVDSVESRGEEETFDLEIAGQYPNFIANGIVVHNSRNAASSRAIPIQRMLDEVATNPARPVFWGKNQAGMQAAEELPIDKAQEAIAVWDSAGRAACGHALRLHAMGVHKQIANRLLEPFAHMTTLVTATEYENFFALRAHRDAQPEFQCLAFKMLEAYLLSEPQKLAKGGWHIPFGDQMPQGLAIQQRLAIGTARAARLSYKTFDGEIDPQKDYQLHDSLKANGHWSPFEHSAAAANSDVRYGNFHGWIQYRKQFTSENRTGVDLSKLLANRVGFTWDK